MNETKPTTKSVPSAAPAVHFGVDMSVFAGNGREPIPVKYLKFNRPTDIPGEDVKTAVKSGGRDNERRWYVEYLPFAQLFAITFIDPQRPVERRTGYVHVSSASSWEFADKPS